MISGSMLYVSIVIVKGIQQLLVPLLPLGVGTISPNHGRLSQMDPFDPKVNYLEGFLPTSNPQLTPALPTQPTYRLGYRLRGQSWRELGFRATGL